MTIDEPTLSPHDGTPMDECPIKPGDLILVEKQTDGEMFYLRIFPGFVGRVILDSYSLRRHHMSRGWYFWMDIIRATHKLVFGQVPNTGFRGDPPYYAVSKEIELRHQSPMIMTWEPEKMRIISEEEWKTMQEADKKILEQRT
jgi:hypothetical protein